MKERDLVKAAIEELLLRGIPAWRNNSGMMRAGDHMIRLGPKGSPDIIGCLPPNGRLLAAEAKVRGGARKDQREFLAAIERAGGLSIVFHTVDQLIERIQERKSVY